MLTLRPFTFTWPCPTICRADARTLSYGDSTTGQSVELRAGSAKGRLVFHTDNGKTLGGDGAHVRITDDRVNGAFSSRDATVLVRGVPKLGVIVASAVVRVWPKPIDGVDAHGRKIRSQPTRKTYTFMSGGGAAIQVGCAS